MNPILMRANEAIQGNLKKMEKLLLDTASGDRLVTSKNGGFSPTTVGRRVGIEESDTFPKISNSQALKSLLVNDDGRYSKARIAGAAAGGLMGVSAAGRIASGGGLYRDSEGNFDIIGIPIV